VASIDLYIVAFGRPDLLRHQIRLIRKNLRDSAGVTVIDNTPEAVPEMELICQGSQMGYMRSPSEDHLHSEALDFACEHALDSTDAEFFGFLDHDIFPRQETTLIEKIEKTGFYGIGQRHAPTGALYLWPGFCFFSRSWLDGRRPNFDGIRGIDKRDDGDCGSANWPLFEHEVWENMWPMEHGYRFIREPDDYGLQSSGVEIIGDWLHLTNGSHWMQVPDPEERDRLTAEMIAAL
jgi:hypothetical protein